MVFKQVKNGTFLLDYAGQRFLVNPAFGENTLWNTDRLRAGLSGTRRNMREYPFQKKEENDIPLIEMLDVDAVIATHLSGTCFDEGARQLIPRGTKIFVKDHRDAAELCDVGFTNLEVLTEHTEFKYFELHKTPVYHGRIGESRQSDRSCGVLIFHPVLNSIYIVGDSIWNDEMKKLIKTWKPQFIIVNAALNPKPNENRSAMSQEELAALHLTRPRAKIITMQAGEDLPSEREMLKSYLWQNRMDSAVLIPEPGVEYRL